MSRAGARWLPVSLIVTLTVASGAVARTSSPPNGGAANEQAARSDAASLLASLNRPLGAVEQSSEPAGDDGALATPASGPPDTPNVVDDHAWWVVPESPQQVLQYIAAHPPAGASAGSFGGSFTAGKSSVTTTGFQWPAIRDQLSIRWLIVGVVALSGGSTGVRADSQVVWITPRPRSERIPATARRVVVTDSRGGTLAQGPITITSRPTVAKVVSLLNALPAWQPGVYSCPADFGWRVRVAVYAPQSGSSSPIAVATIDPNGCGIVRLTLRGKRQPALAGGYTAAKRLSALLHVKLDSGSM
ncbi:MAG TPA: hypothetical protein VMF57_19660 [Solirubrobacteraceae bacterium]|nr:hypothetical protein [Solirubrobacteraceae bacterium]